METFCVEMPDTEDDAAWDEFHALMGAWQEEYSAYADEVAKELNLTQGQALDVIYLRGRSRHSPSLEEELIALLRAGKEPPVLQGWNGEPEEEWDKI